MTANPIRYLGNAHDVCSTSLAAEIMDDMSNDLFLLDSLPIDSMEDRKAIRPSRSLCRRLRDAALAVMCLLRASVAERLSLSILSFKSLFKES